MIADETHVSINSMVFFSPGFNDTVIFLLSSLFSRCHRHTYFPWLSWLFSERIDFGCVLWEMTLCRRREGRVSNTQMQLQTNDTRTLESNDQQGHRNVTSKERERERERSKKNDFNTSECLPFTHSFRETWKLHFGSRIVLLLTFIFISWTKSEMNTNDFVVSIHRKAFSGDFLSQLLSVTGCFFFRALFCALFISSQDDHCVDPVLDCPAFFVSFCQALQSCLLCLWSFTNCWVQSLSQMKKGFRFSEHIRYLTGKHGETLFSNKRMRFHNLLWLVFPFWKIIQCKTLCQSNMQHIHRHLCNSNLGTTTRHTRWMWYTVNRHERRKCVDSILTLVE